MEPSRGSGPGAWLLTALGAFAALFLVGAMLGLGPFKEEELLESELLVRGDEICRAAHEAFLDLQVDPPQTPNEAAALTRNLVGISEDELDRLDELEPPPALESALERYLEAREEGIELLRDGLEAAEARDPGAYDRAQAELEESQPERRRLARAVGFAVCSRPLAAD